MINSLLATKKQMSQVFIDAKRVGVTSVVCGPCVVVQIKNDTDGNTTSLQIGFGEKSTKNITKPQRGHLKGAMDITKKAPLFLTDVKVSGENTYKVGDLVNVSDIFSEGDVVSVTGTTKGKGFAGVVKRWGFSGSSRTHGQKSVLRAPGSIGQGTTPGRVRKGKKMAGRMGGDTNTVKNLKVIAINDETNEMVISGSIPGRHRSKLLLTKIKSDVKEIEEKEEKKD